MATMLEVTDLAHHYGVKTEHVAIEKLSFSVETGDVVCIVGPSGCGKSTLLRAVAGLLRPAGGQVRLSGNLVLGVPSDLAVVFQDYSRSLFPWMSVRRNVEFPLRSRGLSGPERRRRAAEALEWVGLSGSRRKYPWQLSGGMQQRVAIARALACRPALLLMDEPFASVDAQTRFELEDLLLRVRAQLGSTVLLVTHDIDESIYLADRVLVLSKSPASLVAELPVELGEQRDQITTRESPGFVRLRSEVARLLQVRDGAEETAATPQESTEPQESAETQESATPEESTVDNLADAAPQGSTMDNTEDAAEHQDEAASPS